MSEIHKKVCSDLNYFELFFAFNSAISSCVSISTFTSLVGVSVGIAISAVESKFVQYMQELKSISRL